MDLANYALRHKAVTLVFTLLVAIGGYLSYQSLGRLEDPQFTIKEAVIFTQYPGATAAEVEEEVTEPLETAIQQLKQLKEVRSISRSGVSIIYAEIQDTFDGGELPQVWDELRRKVNDAVDDLPPGCGTPAINDDFGDVYGVFLAITGDGYTFHDLREFAKDLRRELLLCDDVGSIDTWGVRPEVVYVEIDRANLARLGIAPSTIFNTITAQNTVSPAGDIKVSSEKVDLRVTGGFESIKAMEELLIPAPQGSDGGSRMIRLKDVATVEHGYLDPPTELQFHNGKPAISIGISTVDGGNVVTMGEAVQARLAELTPKMPVGIEIEPIAFQADTVKEAVSGFVVNLLEAVVIVIVLLVLFMGLREGVIMGVVLLVTILGTFIFMKMWDVNLQRISLGALVIALGMLVDNAIVVTEGIVMKLMQGVPREKAATDTVREVQWPLLGATIIAIMAFAAISVSDDTTGEFLGSLFQVIAISLGLSWIFAVTITPWLCVSFLKEPKEIKEAHTNWLYRGYRGFLRFCIDYRWLTLAAVAGIFMVSMYSFQFVKKNFFPDSTRSQFTVDIWYPAGTHIENTADGLTEMSGYIRTLPHVTATDSFAGRGAMRFILTYAPEMPDSSYGQIIVSVEEFEAIPGLMQQVEQYLAVEHPRVVSAVEAFKLGPSAEAVEARLIGEDPMVLRQLADQVMAIMRDNENTRTIRHNWRQRVKTLHVHMAEAQSREAGVTRPDISNALAMNFSGLSAGVYRDGDTLLPIMLRPPKEQRQGVSTLDDVQVWSSAANTALPIGQVTDGSHTVWEDPIIRRLDRKRTLTVSCQQREGTAMSLFAELRPGIEAIDFPPGYTLEWGGEYEKSSDANSKLMANVPLAFSIMFFISVMLFNSLRHPLIIFLGLPMALIGVVAGLLTADQPFGFMAMLGFLSLSGMLIKNEIVLLDQINLEIANGKEPYQAVIDSAVSRVRPVCMAAFTTVLGMIPLIWDAFFAAMAVTIMAGLTFATALTLANAGDTILLGPGIHTIDAMVDLPTGVSLVGSGNHRVFGSVIRPSWTASGEFRIDGHAVRCRYAGDNRIADLVIDGNGDAIPCGIFTDNSDRITISNVTVVDTNNCGIWIHKGDDWLIEDCTVIDCGGEYDGYSSGNISFGNTRGGRISGCQI
ncbi:MAG: efflux RND transporter permease subunit, partial [Oceanidesulfovibrio sp.]